MSGKTNTKQFNHGTIMRTGIIGKKIPCHMRNLAYRLCIVKNTKIFWGYVKDLKSVKNLARLRKTGSRLNYPSKFSSISQSYFSTNTIKQSQRQLTFRTFMKKPCSVYSLLSVVQIGNKCFAAIVLKVHPQAWDKFWLLKVL